MYRVWHPPCCLNHVTHVGSYAANVPHLAPTLLPQPVTHVGSYAANVPHLAPRWLFEVFFDFLRFFTWGFLVQIYCEQVPPDIKVAFWNFLGHKSDFLRFFWLPPLLFTLPILTFWDCRWHKSDFLRFFCFFLNIYLSLYCSIECFLRMFLSIFAYILLFYVIFSVQVWFMKEKFWI